MPYQIVASQLLTVGFSQLSNGVSIGESESVLRRLRCIPLPETVSKYAYQNLGHWSSHSTFCEFPGVIWPKSWVLFSCLT